MAAAAACLLPPRTTTLALPLAPLAQRIEEKKAREAARLRRRTARRQLAAARAAAAGASAVASGNTTADLVRNALAQPLGAMAARILTAAASGTPLLFPDAAGPLQLPGGGALTGGAAPLAWASRSSSSSPSSAAGVPTTRLPSSAPKPVAAVAQRSPTLRVPDASVHGRQRETKQRRDRRSPQPRSHPSRPQLSALSNPQPVRDSFAEGSPSPLSLLLHPTQHAASAPAAAAGAGTFAGASRRRRRWREDSPWRRSRCSRCGHQRRPRSSVLEPADALEKSAMGPPSPSKCPPASFSTPTTADAAEISDSPISKLARTLRDAGTAALAASPLMRVDSKQPPRQQPSHYARSPSRVSSGEDAHGSTAAAWDRSPSHASLPSNKPPSRSRSPSPASSYCQCSSRSASSCSPVNEPGAPRGAAAAASAPFTPLTLPRPGDTHYNACAATMSLLRCYADSATRGVFSRVPSTSTQRSASRSSTPLSSEWSVHSSSVGDGDKEVEAGRRNRTADGSPPPQKDAEGGGPPSRRHAPAHSPTSNTQLSYIAEMDAIERGVVAPYVSYLFSPEARVVDLRALEGLVRRRDPAPPLEATCVGFSQAADAYLVGTSSGLLWRVPVRNPNDVVRATPLGSLWPPQAPTAPALAGLTATAPTAAAAGSTSALDGAAPPTRTSTTTTTPATAAAQPMPLPGHTAAVLSIAFNDDGALFATAGMDGCVIVWNGRACAKVRRISAVWASAAAAAASTQALYPGVGAGLSSQAPYLVRFMPQNNNYLLVSYLGSSELHLYNSSTGLPVTNVAGAGLARGGGGGGARGVADKLGRRGVGLDGDGRGGGGSHRGSSSGGASVSDAAFRGGDADGRRTRGAEPAAFTPVAITALAVDRIASPFFLTGDAHGTVVMWTYRAGDVVLWPTLRSLDTAAAAGASTGAGGGPSRHSRSRSYVPDTLLQGPHARTSSSSSIGGGGDGLAAFAVPLYELPELRRVAALALPESMGGVAALAVSTLHTAQLHSLFQRRGPRHDGAGECAATAASQPAPRHPLEATAHTLRSMAEQNRACWASAAAAAGGDVSDTAVRSRREKQSTGAAGGAAANAAPSSTASVSTSSFTHALAALPSRLTDTFSSLWGGSGGGGGGTSATAKLPSTQSPTPATTPSHQPSTTASAGGGGAALPSLSENELLRQLRDDALDAVCPLMILVTLPCDTIYVLGLLLQLRPAARPGGSGSSGAAGAASASAPPRQHQLPRLQHQQPPIVTYRLYPLLKTTSPSRLRHLGVGAVQSPDNPRVIVVATPCEEGFVRIEPLLRTPPSSAAASAAVAARHHAAGDAATASAEGSGEGIGAAVGPAPRSRSHVLATLPMPYGGRCTGVAWSPNGRFLVAITAEGVVYQWARVYLLNTSSPRLAASPSTGADAAGAAATTGTAPATSAAAAAMLAATGAAAATTVPHSVVAVDGAARTPALAVDGVARRRGCATEHSDTAVQGASPTANFISLLGAPMASAAAASAGTLPAAADSSAARAAFCEEDAWRESLRRELERQRRAQAALKLVSRAGPAEVEETVSGSGYCIDDGAGTAVTEESPDDSAMDSESYA